MGSPPRWAPGEIPHLPSWLSSRTGSWVNPHLASGVPRHLSKKGGVYLFQGITEADSRPLLRQPSSTHQSAALCHADLPWHQWPEALPCWTEDFACPAVRLAPEILPCKMLTTPVPTVCHPDLQTESLGLGFVIPH